MLDAGLLDSFEIKNSSGEFVFRDLIDGYIEFVASLFHSSHSRA